MSSRPGMHPSQQFPAAGRALVVGDVHQDAVMVTWASEMAHHYRADVIVQVGDFGWWPRSGSHHRRFVEALDETRVPWVFCDGNHEDHRYLNQRPDRPVSIHPGVWHVPRGVTIVWGTRRVLFYGGAVSVDRHKRIAGQNWFADEISDVIQRDRALAAGHVDIVVAHDVPDGWDGLDLPPGVWPDELVEESTRHRLFCSTLAVATRPRMWLAGHYHQRVSGAFDTTRIEVLAGNTQRPWHRVSALLLDLETLEISNLEAAPHQRRRR